MKTELLKMLVFVFGFSCFGLAQGEGVESVKTKISDKTSLKLKSKNRPDRPRVLGVVRCEGAGGYKLEIVKYAHHRPLYLVTNAGERLFIDMYTPRNEMSYLSGEIEWRGRRSGNVFKPTSIIFEHDIRDPRLRESRLAVVRIRPNSACLVADAVFGGSFGKKEARIFADNPKLRCLSRVDFRQPEVLLNGFDSVAKFVNSRTSSRGSGVSFSAEGDLNGDGAKDWVGVVWDTKPDHFGGYQNSRLYVLLKDKKTGKYQVDASSKNGTIRNSTCCYVEDLRITNKSIYLQVNVRRNEGITAKTYQFRRENKSAWRLIGLRIYNAFPATENKDDSALENEMNLLTVEIITSWYTGEKQDGTQKLNESFEKFYLRDFKFENVPAEAAEQPPPRVQ